MDHVMYERDRMTRPPTHPGAVLKRIVLADLRMSVESAATEMKVKTQDLEQIVRGETRLTPEMAVKFGRFCGNGPWLWASMQTALDIWNAQRSLRDELDSIPVRREARR